MINGTKQILFIVNVILWVILRFRYPSKKCNPEFSETSFRKIKIENKSFNDQ